MGRSHPHLSLEERRKIEDWWHAKVPSAEISDDPPVTMVTLALSRMLPPPRNASAVSVKSRFRDHLHPRAGVLDLAAQCEQSALLAEV